MTFGGRSANSFAAERLIVTWYSATKFALLHKTLFHRLEWFPWVVLSLFKSQGIKEVFPDRPISLEIDLYRDLLALVIRDEVNAFQVELSFLRLSSSCLAHHENTRPRTDHSTRRRELLRDPAERASSAFARDARGLVEMGLHNQNEVTKTGVTSSMFG